MVRRCPHFSRTEHGMDWPPAHPCRLSCRRSRSSCRRRRRRTHATSSSCCSGRHTRHHWYVVWAVGWVGGQRGRAGMSLGTDSSALLFHEGPCAARKTRRAAGRETLVRYLVRVRALECMSECAQRSRFMQDMRALPSLCLCC